MADFTKTRQYTYADGAIIFAHTHNTNETTIYTGHNDSMHETTGHGHTGTTGDGPILGATAVSIEDSIYIPPIGSIIPFYDFNAAVTFDTDAWIYCDGAVISDASSPLDGLTLPDLSNRYLVGFGTEGGGDIDSAAWATPAVGQASHQINIQHAHTMTGHNHTGPSHDHDLTFDISPFTSGAGTAHSHTNNTLALTNAAMTGALDNESAHTHTRGTFYARIAMPAQGGASTTEIEYQSETVSAWTATDRCDSVQDQSSSQSVTAGVPIAGTSSAGSAHTHGLGTLAITNAAITGATADESTHTHSIDPPSAGPFTSTSAGTGVTSTTIDTMNNQLSTTQTIQPRSIRVRYIMRKR